MHAHSRRSGLAGAFAVIALLAGACGTTTDEPEETVTVTTTPTSATSDSATTTTTSAQPQPDTEPPPQTTASPAAPVPSPSAAPQAPPPPPPPPQASGPQIGDFCIGADIGRRRTDAAGTAIVCDNYEWRPDLGQRPSHPWVDDQVAFMECLEEFTQEECREMLN